MAGTAESFARKIALRFPIVLTEPEYDCAGLILAKKSDAAFSQIFPPGVADSLVAGKVARSRNDQPGLHGVEESF